MNTIRITFYSHNDDPPVVQVCAFGFIDDHTICGLSTESGTIPDAQSDERVTLPIDCPQCIQIIRGCKAISAKNIKPKPSPKDASSRPLAALDNE